MKSDWPSHDLPTLPRIRNLEDRQWARPLEDRVGLEVGRGCLLLQTPPLRD